LFCSEFRQLSKIRAVEPSVALCLVLRVQRTKPGHPIALREGGLSINQRFDKSTRMLRIERSANGQVVFTLSGRMQTQDVEQFRQLLVVESPAQRLLFDLRDVTLVNQDAITFLAGCEAEGIKLENCPLHVRNWIDQEKRRNQRRKKQKREVLKPPAES
jgi:hypothetical protein